jgi:hypothetical protein
MDPAKVSFLFGEVPDGFDVEDPDDRAELVELDGDEPLATARSAVGRACDRCSRSAAGRSTSSSS